MNTKLETADLRWTVYPHTDPEEPADSPRRTASVLYVEIRFTMMECSSLPYNSHRSCKETFNLYHYQTDTDEATNTHPAWMENPYTKPSKHRASAWPLLAVRVYFKKCPPLTRSFSRFPETVPHALVEGAQGVCVDNAVTPPGRAGTPSQHAVR
ncbi:hypothetical protein J4Q44_G00052900 [Coregonus suidteri]|uniref:Eph LBD domain-containing protein n=1 Tax=Coregonus suidteri TaxID=861788 RepID=A0AAN8N9V7_9TELE